MEPKYYRYYAPKVFIGAAVLLVVNLGLATCFAPAHGGPGWWVSLLFLLPLLPVNYFFITGTLLPVIQKQPVCIIDEKGINDITTWGIIEWANIQNLSRVVRKSRDPFNRYSFVQVHVKLHRLTDLNNYVESPWVRFRAARTHFRYGKEVDIVLDIDALEGRADNVFADMATRFEYYRSR